MAGRRKLVFALLATAAPGCNGNADGDSSDTEAGSGSAATTEGSSSSGTGGTASSGTSGTGGTTSGSTGTTGAGSTGGDGWPATVPADVVIRDMAANAAGEVFLVGTQGDAPPWKGWTQKLAPDGSVAWTTLHEDPMNEGVGLESVVALPDGGAVVTGGQGISTRSTVLIQYGVDGSPSWTTLHPDSRGTRVARSPAGDLYVAGDDRDAITTPTTEIWLGKFTAAGDHVWSHVDPAPVSKSGTGYDVVVDPLGATIALVGRNIATLEWRILAVDAAGGLLWQDTLPNIDPRAIAVDAAGSFYALGEDENWEHPVRWMRQYTNTGAVGWTVTDPAEPDVAIDFRNSSDIAVGSDDLLYVSGARCSPLGGDCVDEYAGLIRYSLGGIVMDNDGTASAAAGPVAISTEVFWVVYSPQEVRIASF